MATFWLLLTITMLSWFVVTVIIVAIKGYSDLKTMFANLDKNR